LIDPRGVVVHERAVGGNEPLSANDNLNLASFPVPRLRPLGHRFVLLAWPPREEMVPTGAGEDNDMAEATA
jgi:hypothetical protein